MYLVVGASGGFGGAVVRALRRRGLPVRALVRDPSRARLPEGVEVVAGDARDLPTVLEAAKGCEALFDGLNAPVHHWPTTLLRLHDNMVEVSGLTGAPLVFLQTVHGLTPVYDVPLPVDTPPPDAIFKPKPLARLRGDLEAQVEQNAALRAVRGVVVRACDLVGSGVRYGIGGETKRAVAAGAPVPWYAATEVGHAFSFVDDAAEIAVTAILAEGRPTYEVLHAPSHPFASAAEWAAALGKAAGRPVRARVVPEWHLKVRGVWDREAWGLLDLRAAWEGIIRLDDSHTLRALPEFRPVERDEALAAWLG